MLKSVKGMVVGLCFLVATELASGQAIDFETIPGGTATTDRQLISDQYEAAFGVRFDLVDPITLAVIGAPEIAKVGGAQTAFAACGSDTPSPGQGVGLSFLTDDGVINNNPGTLLLTYTEPVAQAAGVILDIDRRAGGAFEQWTIEALDSSMSVIDTIVLTAPGGTSECGGSNGFGDGRAMGFVFDHPVADIDFIVLRYTGTAGSVGLAFDNFSPTTFPSDPQVTLSDDANAQCYGDTITISTSVEFGLPGFVYQWQRAPAGGVFVDLVGEVAPMLFAPAQIDAYEYRVVVTDSIARAVTSDPLTLEATVRMPSWTLKVETAPGSGVFDTLATDITPFEFDQSIDAVYQWSQGEQYYHGAEPALTIDRSHLFLTIAPGGQSLVVIHDGVGANGGGRAEMRIEFTNATPGFVSLDDPFDRYLGEGTNVLEARHSWDQPNTDGFAVGPLGGSWSAAVQFTDAFSGSPTIDGLSEWSFLSADGLTYQLPLEEDRIVLIEASCILCPADLTGDGSLNFFDVSAFLSAFAAMDPVGDFTGDGQFNFFDVSAFLAAFAAGCP